jgi:hypothetical protein
MRNQAVSTTDQRSRKHKPQPTRCHYGIRLTGFALLESSLSKALTTYCVPSESDAQGQSTLGGALVKRVSRHDEMTTVVTRELESAFPFGHQPEVIALHAIRASDGIRRHCFAADTLASILDEDKSLSAPLVIGPSCQRIGQGTELRGKLDWSRCSRREGAGVGTDFLHGTITTGASLQAVGPKGILLFRLRVLGRVYR